VPFSVDVDDERVRGSFLSPLGTEKLNKIIPYLAVFVNNSVAGHSGAGMELLHAIKLAREVI
jgi:hypothetical protein